MFINVSPVDIKTASLYSPLTLAYLGDCVYELAVREHLVQKANKPNGKLHAEALAFVSASSQAKFCEKILSVLSEDETAIYKRGRNADSSPHKNSDIGEYKSATGLEALIGYLYLTGSTERLITIFDIIFAE